MDPVIYRLNLRLKHMQSVLQEMQAKKQDMINIKNYGRAHEFALWCEGYEGGIMVIKSHIEEECKEMIRSYYIESKAGQQMGIYKGRTAADALLNMHRDAGCHKKQVWLSENWENLEFCDEETKKTLGDIDDWIIAQHYSA